MLSPRNSPVIGSSSKILFQTLNILLRGGRIISGIFLRWNEKRKASVCCLSVSPSRLFLAWMWSLRRTIQYKIGKAPCCRGFRGAETYAPADSPGAAQRCTRPAYFSVLLPEDRYISDRRTETYAVRIHRWCCPWWVTGSLIYSCHCPCFELYCNVTFTKAWWR